MPLLTTLGTISAAGYSRGNVGSGPFIDGMSVTPSGAFGLRLLRSAYTGNCIRIRRSNDNAETNIGFVDKQLDTASITSFVGANSAYVTTWYDQSGNTRNLTQTTAASQPRIVNAGTLDTKNSQPVLVFSGSQFMTRASGSAFGDGSGQWSANTVAYSNSVAPATPIGLVDSDTGNTAGERYAQFLRITTTGRIETITFNNTALPFLANAGAGVLAANTYFVATSTRSTSSLTAYVNGTAGTPTTTTGTAITTSVSFAIGKYQGPAGNTVLTGGIAEVIMVGSVLTANDRNLMQRNQGAFFGVTVS